MLSRPWPSAACASLTHAVVEYQAVADVDLKGKRELVRRWQKGQR